MNGESDQEPLFKDDDISQEEQFLLEEGKLTEAEILERMVRKEKQ